MALFKKHSDPAQAPEPQVMRRIRMVETAELIPWTEACLYEIGRSLSEHRKDGEEHHLADAKQAVVLANELISELQSRQAAVAPFASDQR